MPKSGNKVWCPAVAVAVAVNVSGTLQVNNSPNKKKKRTRRVEENKFFTALLLCSALSLSLLSLCSLYRILFLHCHRQERSIFVRMPGRPVYGKKQKERKRRRATFFVLRCSAGERGNKQTENSFAFYHHHSCMPGGRRTSTTLDGSTFSTAMQPCAVPCVCVIFGKICQWEMIPIILINEIGPMTNGLYKCL